MQGSVQLGKNDKSEGRRQDDPAVSFVGSERVDATKANQRADDGRHDCSPHLLAGQDGADGRQKDLRQEQIGVSSPAMSAPSILQARPKGSMFVVPMIHSDSLSFFVEMLIIRAIALQLHGSYGKLIEKPA